MRSGQLIVFGFVLACVGLSGARFLSVREPTYWGREVEVEPAAEPEREISRESTQQAGMIQAEQLRAEQLRAEQLQAEQLQAEQLQAEQLQAEVQPLTWKFPEDPVDSVEKSPVEFELRQPVTTNRVAVRCGESRVQVEVSQDLLGLGRLIEPEDITLGGCSATEIDSLSHVLVFESELHGCGSTLLMTERIFVYAFTLDYNPKVSGRSPIMRSQSAVVGVECHYPR